MPGGQCLNSGGTEIDNDGAGDKNGTTRIDTFMPLLHLEPLPRRTTKGEVLQFVERVGQLSSRSVGKIEIRGAMASVEIPDGWEGRLLKSLDGQMFGERRIRARISSERVGNRGNCGNEDHFSRLARLLDLESKAEAQRVAKQARRLSPFEAEKTGNTLVDLSVVDENPGLGGRFVVQFVRRTRSPLPWTRLNVGSPVVVSPFTQRADLSYRGVVCERSESALSVALDNLPDELGDHDIWRMDLSFDEVATQRQRAALEQARLLRGDRSAILRDVLIGVRQPEFGLDPAVSPLDRTLNATQIEAVQFAISARDVGLIHGPPGTGKTTTVVEVIRQAVRRGRKVLACAPSNMAVDNLFEKLLKFRERVVRLGHPARVMPELREHTLDLLVEQHPDVRLARRLVKQAMSLFREAGRYRRAAPKPGERKQLRDDARSLLADARKMELQAAESILNSAAVICATTTGIDSQLIGPRRFDLVVIDEACQSTEPGCWIPLLRGDRLILAGDHCQLPPTIVSQEAAAEGFGTSLFERLVNEHGPEIARLLTVQYRMHQSIMDFPSRELYDGQLQADPSVRNHRLCDLPDVTTSQLTQWPVEFIDTAGASYDEELEPDGESRMNRREAALVTRKVRTLIECGVAQRDIAVISPYGAQVRLLRELLELPSVEVDTVDGFQGREKEAVVISLVRSNPKGEIGFLSDIRRMNVAATRARRKLLIIGDSATLAGHPFYKRLLEYCESINAYRTVWEEA